MTATIQPQHIEYFITLFYFNLSRKSDDSHIHALGIQLSDFVRDLKTATKHPDSSPKDIDTIHSYIRLMFCMIFHTRDISHGKGERKLTYMMLCAWYRAYPIPTLVAIRLMLGGRDKYSVGCWRDIKHLCTYAQAQNIPELADAVIDIAHQQTISDFESKSNSDISNIAKWLPRETSRSFSWIFRRLAILWAEEYTPRVLQTFQTNEKRNRALNLCYKNYRIVVSAMNRKLETPEIKLCANTLSTQSQLNIPTYSKLNHITPKNSPEFVCIRNFYKKLSYKYNRSSPMSVVKCNYKLPVYHYVKKSLELKGNKESVEINYLNHQWNRFVSSHDFEVNNVIPMIDMSHSMSRLGSLALYAAVGIGAMINARSIDTPGMILVDDTSSYMPMLESISEITSAIFKSNPRNTDPDFIAAFRLVAESATATNMTSDHVRRLTFVILSNMNFLRHPEYRYFGGVIADIFHNAGLNSLNGIPFPSPRIILWNLAEENIVDDAIPLDFETFTLFSGFSTQSIRHIGIDERTMSDNAFSFIRRILQSTRYKNMDTCLRKLRKV